MQISFQFCLKKMERKKTNAALVFAYRKMLKINAPEADDFGPSPGGERPAKGPRAAASKRRFLACVAFKSLKSAKNLGFYASIL